MAEKDTTAEQFDPSTHSVEDVRAHLASADDAERDRVLTAERDGKARTTLLESPEATATTTRAKTFQEVTQADQRTDTEREADDNAAAAENYRANQEALEAGYFGESPERVRTGLDDKGLSQKSPGVMNQGPAVDSRPNVDDSEAIAQARKAQG